MRGSSTLGTAVEQLVVTWMNSNKDNKHFGFIDLGQKDQKKRVSIEIKDALMIGKKGKVYNANIEGLVQPEREKISNKGCPPWFEKYILIFQSQTYWEVVKWED